MKYTLHSYFGFSADYPWQDAENLEEAIDFIATHEFRSLKEMNAFRQGFETLSGPLNGFSLCFLSDDKAEIIEYLKDIYKDCHSVYDD